jgi:hypothetical protein
MLVIVGYIENSSLLIQPVSNAQALILDFLFPGFTRISAAIQGYLAIDLNVYIPLLCFFGLFVFSYGRVYKYLFGLLKTYYYKNSLYSNTRTYFLIISSFNYSSSISWGYIWYIHIVDIILELRLERSLLPRYYWLSLFIEPLKKWTFK